MSKLSDFLGNDPYGEEGKGEGRVFETIGKIKIDVAWQAFLWDKESHSIFAMQYFPFNPSEPGSQADAKQQCENFIKENGYEKKAFPQLGFLVSIPESGNLTDDNVTWDIEDFISSYDSAKRQLGENGALHEVTQAEVEGDLPYDAFLKSLTGYEDMLNEWVWAKTAQITNELTRVQGKKKGDYDYKIRILVEIYASEEAAYEAAGVAWTETPDNVLEESFSDNGGLSETALQGSWTLETLKNQAGTIHEMIANAQRGEGVPGNEQLSNKKAIAFVCQQIGIEASDLKLIPLEEIAF